MSIGRGVIIIFLCRKLCITNHRNKECFFLSHITRQQPVFFGGGPTTSLCVNFLTFADEAFELLEPRWPPWPRLRPFLLPLLFLLLWWGLCWSSRPLSPLDLFRIDDPCLWWDAEGLEEAEAADMEAWPLSDPWLLSRVGAWGLLCWATRFIERCFLRSAKVWGPPLDGETLDTSTVEAVWGCEELGGLLTVTFTLILSEGPATMKCTKLLLIVCTYISRWRVSNFLQRSLLFVEM